MNKLVELPIKTLVEASWNPNRMDDRSMNRLKESIKRYGIIVPLVVRPISEFNYETLSGNHRLKIIREMLIRSVPCVIVHLDDAQAMLLAEALNQIHGEDDLALKGELFRKVLEIIPTDQILSLLPETSESLSELSSIKEIDIAEHLRSWEQARSVRLKHMQLQFTSNQLDLVEEAIIRMLPAARAVSTGNPNIRSVAVFLICKSYLEKEEQK